MGMYFTNCITYWLTFIQFRFRTFANLVANAQMLLRCMIDQPQFFCLLMVLRSRLYSGNGIGLVSWNNECRNTFKSEIHRAARKKSIWFELRQETDCSKEWLACHFEKSDWVNKCASLTLTFYLLYFKRRDLSHQISHVNTIVVFADESRYSGLHEIIGIRLSTRIGKTYGDVGTLCRGS